MIDTIAIMSPELDNRALYLLGQKSKTNTQIDKSTGEQRQYSPYGAVENEYGIPINFKIYQGTKVRLEASVHKLLTGNNVYGGPKDFHSSAAYLVNEFELLMEIELPPVMDWTVQRVDVEEFYRLKSQSKCTAWFNAMGKADFPRREIQKYGNHSIFIPGRTTVVKFYNKGLELLQNKSDFKRLIRLMGKEDCVKLLYKAYGIIKVEVEIKRDKIACDFNGECTVKAITNEYLEKVHDYEVNKLLKEDRSSFEQVCESGEVFNRLESVYGPAMAAKLMGFWNQLAFYGEKKTMKSMSSSRSTYYNYLKRLKEAGIDWKKNLLSTSSAALIPPDFSPVRGNKYHMDITLDEVDQKLLPYLKER